MMYEVKEIHKIGVLRLISFVTTIKVVDFSCNRTETLFDIRNWQYIMNFIAIHSKNDEIHVLS